MYAAAIDSNGLATAWDPSPDSIPSAILPAGGSIYVIGAFTVIGGQPRFGVAAVDAAGAATAWAPQTSSGTFLKAICGRG